MTSLKDLPTEHSSTNGWPKSLPSAPLPHESLTNTREVSASWQRNWNNAHFKTKHNLMLPNATMCLEQPRPWRSPSMELSQVSLHAERKRSRVTLLIHDQNKTDPSTEITWSRLHIFREDTYVHTLTHTHTHTLANTYTYTILVSKQSLTSSYPMLKREAIAKQVPWFPSNHEMTNNCKLYSYHELLRKLRLLRRWRPTNSCWPRHHSTTSSANNT